MQDTPRNMPSYQEYRDVLSREYRTVRNELWILWDHNVPLERARRILVERGRPQRRARAMAKARAEHLLAKALLRTVAEIRCHRLDDETRALLKQVEACARAAIARTTPTLGGA